MPGRMRMATGALAANAAALLGVGCMGGDASEPEPGGGAAKASEPAGELLPPSDLDATSEHFRVTLTWAPPDAAVDGFTIYRDGFRYPNLPATATSYVDDTAVPGETYVYEVGSVRGKENSQDRASTTVALKSPPLRAARLQGWFSLKAPVRALSGFSELERTRFSMHFRPRCREGACDVRWKVYHRRARGTLTRNGARYTGRYSGVFGSTCEGSQIVSDVTIELRVSAARAIGRSWRAVRLRGWLEEKVAQQSSCRSGLLRFGVRARLTDG